jgi:hypothetical protein
MEDSAYSSQNQVLPDAVGSSPELSKSTLEPTNRTVNSVNQAFSVCETMVSDWKKGILFAARITAKINGEKPYNQKKLKDAGKDYKTNVSTGFLATECARVVPRLFMPIKTAKYLTAACLPNNWPNALEKTEFFRQTVTETIRSWPKFNFYIRGLAREVGIYGFASNAFFDKYDWRPNLMRVDKGFVPQGTEIMDEPQFFMAKYDYSPNELLDLLKTSIDSGRSEWMKENVVNAIQDALPPPVDATYPNARVYEELIRQASWSYTYTKGARKISTYQLFAKEATGKVSHYILLAGDQPIVTKDSKPDGKKDSRLLYEFLDKYPSMGDAANTMVFDFGDGTIHGSWGTGQILYDLAVHVEKIRCDGMDNMRMSNKMKLTVADGKNVNDVKLSINDQWMLVSSAQFSGNTAGLTTDMEGYELLDQKLSQLAQQKIGAFVPPIPLQPSDVKAAQVNAAMAKERELQEALLENWLIQFAVLVRAMTRRLSDNESPDAVAKKFQEKLLTRLTREEINMLATEFPIQSVMDFTEYRAQQKAAFCASIAKDPRFRQDIAARHMAGGVGDARFVDEIIVPEGDNSMQLAAQRQQQLENAAMVIGQDVPILPQDMDWVHMTTLKPSLSQTIQSGNAQLAEIGLRHYAAHYAQAVDKKEIPPEQINPEKSWIAAAEKTIAALAEQAQIQQATKQAQEQSAKQAQEIVGQEQNQLAPAQ